MHPFFLPPTPARFKSIGNEMVTVDLFFELLSIYWVSFLKIKAQFCLYVCIYIYIYIYIYVPHVTP